MISVTRITGSGQVTIPAELRRKHDLKAGDRVLWTEDARGQMVVKVVGGEAEGLSGIFAPLPGVSVEGDFDDIIAEAFEAGVNRKVAELRGDHDAE